MDRRGGPLVRAWPRLVLALSSGVFCGCATIVSNEADRVSFSSSPAGAEATIRNKRGMLVHQEKTPFELDLDAHEGFFDSAQYHVRFEKECHQPADVLVDATVDEWYFGNILFGGVIGMLIVDPATGEMWEIDEYVGVALEPTPDCPAPPPPPTARPSP